jgi:hypothetical protein
VLHLTALARFSLAVTLTLGCGSALAPAEPESTTLQLGHRVGGGRVAEASSDEISISTGMRADLELFEPHTLEGGGFSYAPDQMTPAEIRTAVSTDEATVRVVSLRGSYATLEALAPGTARVTFETTRGTRTFSIHVAEPASVRLAHFGWSRLPEGARVAFVRGGIARFEMTRRDMAHRVLGGYGGTMPVRVDPPRAARLSVRDGDVGHVDVHLEQAADAVSLRPLGGEPLDFPIVEPAPEDRVSLAALGREGGEAPLDTVLVGEKTLVTIVLTRADGTRLFGLLGRFALVSTTPELCTVEAVDAIYSDGIHQLERLADGACVLEIQPEEGEPVRVTVGGAAPADAAFAP